MVRFLALLAVLSGFVVALSPGLTDRTRQYVVDSGRIVTRDRSTGRVIWQQPAPAPRFGWLGQADDVLVGVGAAPEPVLVGNVGGNTYQDQMVATVYGLNTRDGGLRWRHPSGARLQDGSRVLRNLVLVITANPAYAMLNTDVLNAKTGRVVLSTTGALVHQDQTQVVFECAFVPTPYCSGFSRTALDRVNLSTAQAEHWELDAPAFEGCSYIEAGPDHISRFTVKTVDYLIEDSCGWVFVRYTWAGGPQQRPLVRRIPGRAWPKGL